VVRETANEREAPARVPAPSQERRAVSAASRK
jgi:hypothetical protein